MAQYSISQISEVVNGELIKSSGGKISYLLIDSRKVLFARESLFFALVSARNNGHRYISDLYEQGVRNYVVSELPENISSFKWANFIKVNNTLEALQMLAAWHRQQFKIPVVGITGSNGKTIVKEWIYQCISPKYNVVRNPKSYNSQIGVPLSVWLIDSNAKLGVFEAGISKPGEMDKLESVLKPDIGIFTNIGDAHQENFETLEQKAIEKLKLFRNSQTIIYNSNNNILSKVISENIMPGQNTFTWGTAEESNLQITNAYSGKTGIHIEATYNNTIYAVELPVVDKASVENAMQVASLMVLMGLSPEYITNALKNLESVAMRLELREGINNCTIINDSYNSDLESLHIALDYLGMQNQHSQKTLILSDIAQSGYEPEQLYKKVAQMIQQKSISRLIGIGSQISQYSELFETRKDIFATTEEFLANFTISKLSNTTILLKGARSFQFEKISAILRKQSNRTEFEIDLTAIESNLKYFKKLLKPATGIIAMVKAFSYGSGTHEIANICQYQRVAALAVAFADEGIDLRNTGNRLPILVMNPEQESFSQMIEYNLEPQLNNVESLIKFDKTAGEMGQGAYPVHIKLDTGMHRSGFTPDDISVLAALVKNLEHLHIKTVFSHLSSADEEAQDEYTHQQAALFMQMTSEIENALGYKIKRHILNSAGAERFPEYQFDYVRIGIGLYGISAINAKLEQAGTLRSTIAQIKTVKAGSTVGYNRKGVVNKETNVAVVPMGYADGLRRSLSNGKGKFLLHGQQVPILGNVCMDLCMLDITGIDANVGDTVELFGKNQSIYKVAEWMDTIPYEVLTGISRRVKRTYLME